MDHTAATFDVSKVRRDFPILAEQVNGKPLVYLDNAATTLKPNRVIEAIEHHYRHETANVHRGVHTLSERATAAYEGAREKIRRFLNAASREEILLTGGTTDSINLVAQCFGRAFIGAGDEILITEMEHHSNIVPWQMLCEEKKCVLKVVPFNEDGELDMDAYRALLGPKTKLVAAVYISNSLGTINPVREMIGAARAQGTPVLIDAAQAVSYAPIDVQDLDCDFLAFSGHKLFGPTGVGVLYGKKDLLNRMPPYRGGGDMIESVSFAKTTFNSLPYKFEAGTPNIADVIGLGAAIDYVAEIGLPNTHPHRQELLRYATAKLEEIPGVRIIGRAREKTSVISFVHPDVHAHDMGTLVDKQGVAIRTGHHCTQPVMDHFEISATSRASVSLYNTIEEMDILAEAVRKAIDIFH
ncbi:MAG: cysteine desulfurase [Candidatus Omnitrophica bacterium]|nr:cysteine desulfurase [Candidatus Omnitrophota bacterium]MCB9721854.1 cysteine desulfurase [Candidatus Omnitrophota bacterium]